MKRWLVAGGLAMAGTAAADDAMIDRPFTLTSGGRAAYIDLDIPHLSVNGTVATLYGLHVGGAAGLTDHLTLGLEYTTYFAGDGTDNIRGKGPLDVYGMYALVNDDVWTLAVEADFEVNFAGRLDAMNNVSVSEAIHAGVDLRYRVTPRFALFTGNPFGPGVPGATGALVAPAINPYGVGRQLSIGLNGGSPSTLAFPVGAAWQAKPRVFLFLDTVLAAVAIANSPYSNGSTGTRRVAVLGEDAIGIPANLGALFAVTPHLDLGATWLDNLKAPGDVYVLAVVMRWTRR